MLAVGGQHGMPKAYSNDLRERVAASVVSGRTCRETAALFGVSIASAVKWSQRLRSTGSASARPMGRKQPRSLAAERAFVLARVKADVTLRAVVAELAERGIATSYGSVWRLVREDGLSFKKNAAGKRAGSSRRRQAAPKVEDPSGPT